jgi:hypothetical protein
MCACSLSPSRTGQEALYSLTEKGIAVLPILVQMGIAIAPLSLVTGPYLRLQTVH